MEPVKPRDPVRSVYGRRSVARTEVKATQSVNPIAPPDPLRSGVALQDVLTHDLVDPKSRELLYKERDERRRRAAAQAADNTLMCQRAYHAPLATNDESAGSDSEHADLKI